jgi:hypothetical protein
MLWARVIIDEPIMTHTLLSIRADESFAFSPWHTNHSDSKCEERIHQLYDELAGLSSSQLFSESHGTTPQ